MTEFSALRTRREGQVLEKNHVSLYVGNASEIDSDGELLKGLNIGKGCIRFTKTVDLSKTRIEVFIRRAISLWRQGLHVGC